jgi:hypothetical protein
VGVEEQVNKGTQPISARGYFFTNFLMKIGGQVCSTTKPTGLKGFFEKINFRRFIVNKFYGHT